MGHGRTRKVCFREMLFLNFGSQSVIIFFCRYHSLAPMYYRGAQAAIVVYDIQNQDSFQRAKTWVKELQRQVRTKAYDECFLAHVNFKHYKYSNDNSFIFCTHR